MSLQAAISEGGSDEEPLEPIDCQAVNHKIKRLQDLKEKSEKLKSNIPKENAQRLTTKSAKINHKIKRLQDLKEKSEKLKNSIQKENAQRHTTKSGKISGQCFNENCLGMIGTCGTFRATVNFLHPKVAQSPSHKTW